MSWRAERKQDPFEFRLALIDDPRVRRLLEKVR